MVIKQFAPFSRYSWSWAQSRDVGRVSVQINESSTMSQMKKWKKNPSKFLCMNDSTRTPKESSSADKQTKHLKHFPVFLQSVPFNSAGRNISALVDLVNPKLRSTLWSPTSRELFSTVESHFTKLHQEKVTRSKFEKFANGTLKMALFTQRFLGFTTIIL